MNRKRIIALVVAGVVAISALAFGLSRNRDRVNALTSEEAQALVDELLPANVEHIGTDEDDRQVTFEYYDEASKKLYEVQVNLRTGDVGTVQEYDMNRELVAADNETTQTDRIGSQATDSTESAAGTEDNSQLISREEAQAIALNRVPGAAASDILEFERDGWYGRNPEYEFDIYYNGSKYEIEISALTGEVVKFEQQTTNSSLSRLDRSDLITAEAARQLVLDRVPGATSEDFHKFKLDIDDGRPEYEGELIYNGIEYDFEIDSRNGNILEWEAEARSRRGSSAAAVPTAAAETQAPVTSESQVPATVATVAPAATATQAPSTTAQLEQISRERAVEIALAKVPGASSAHIEEIEFDYDDGRPEWDFEIKYNGYEYEIEIDGRNGNILKFEVDDD